MRPYSRLFRWADEDVISRIWRARRGENQISGQLPDACLAKQMILEIHSLKNEKSKLEL